MPPRAKTELVTYGIWMLQHEKWLEDQTGKVMEFFSKGAATAQADTSCISWAREDLAVVQFGQKVPQRGAAFSD